VYGLDVLTLNCAQDVNHAGLHASCDSLLNYVIMLHMSRLGQTSMFEGLCHFSKTFKRQHCGFTTLCRTQCDAQLSGHGGASEHHTWHCCGAVLAEQPQTTCALP